MSEPTTATPAAQATPSAPAAAESQTPQQTQGDPADLGDAGKKALDAERSARKAAEKQATDLQAKIDKINQANESAIEKAQREAKEAQETALKAGTDALRYRIAAETGITENVDLILTAADEETMRKQAELWGARTSTTTAGPRPDLSQGSKGTPAGGSSPAQDFEQFLSAQMGH